MKNKNLCNQPLLEALRLKTCDETDCFSTFPSLLFVLLGWPFKLISVGAKRGLRIVWKTTNTARLTQWEMNRSMLMFF